MRLTTYTDYTLRTLIYLALNAGRNATIAQIAATYRISEAHLTKVVHQLGVAGEIETVRGRNGGLRLRRPAEQINIGAVVRRTEPDLELVPCFESAGACTIGPSCVLQPALHEALAAFLAVLDRHTLADLVAPRRRLATLLGIMPQPRSHAKAVGLAG
jgi:Rrf2 family transcriptional regulator, nitric oxide-sensitive transcriptional repressor